MSIVVPIGGDLAAFESTLVSVLENRPRDAEVIVAHNGTYDDPFELCDEVTFATCESNRLVDLVSAAAEQSRGQFVHVLSDGMQATPGWTDAALDHFDAFSTGAVTPAIRDRSGRLIAAGWRDSASRRCVAVTQTKGRRNETVAGPYLQASFWRRELLRSLCEADLVTRSGEETSYAFGRLVADAGWDILFADESEVGGDAEGLPWGDSSLSRGMRLQAIADRFDRRGWKGAGRDAAIAAMCNVARPKRWFEIAGQALSPLIASGVARGLRPGSVYPVDGDDVIVKIPSRRLAEEPLRRAA